MVALVYRGECEDSHPTSAAYTVRETKPHVRPADGSSGRESRRFPLASLPTELYGGG